MIKHTIYYFRRNRACTLDQQHTTSDDVVLAMLVAHGERLGYDVHVHTEE